MRELLRAHLFTLVGWAVLFTILAPIFWGLLRFWKGALPRYALLARAALVIGRRECLPKT